MKISTNRFILITVLIILIPIYANWQLLLNGKKTKGSVIKIEKEYLGQLLSYYSIIEFSHNSTHYKLYGPENVEYPVGKEFTILYMPKKPSNALIFSLRGIYINKYTPIAVILFILWIAFYLSFTPKSQKRKSEYTRFKSNGNYNRRKLV